jgi:protein-tyrosine kinase
MSIVEKALRKLQGSGPASPQAPTIATAPTVVSSALVERGPRTVVRSTRVVTLNHAELRQAGMLPPKDGERRISQQFRQIKRPLIDAAMNRAGKGVENGRVVMVASAMPGEGKTFTSMNLALSLAVEKDVEVLLIDGDVAKPHISRQLGVADAPGLLDALVDHKLDVESLVLNTDFPNLSLLPAGTQTEEATELLASERMLEVTRDLVAHDRHRIVVFDSPPLVLTTESHVVAQIAGQILLVVRAGVTSQRVLTDAIGRLGDHTSVSLVLNQSVTESPGGYYYVAYGDAGRPAADP